ncbi:ABC transporter ATP-binding protein [Psychrobacillus sp. OK032]|uniref:ABC transporter ATP-binding protein n=1 Tax=Psychrobacillus sp. OK032 TaxID=1884358 RepID=UPI0008BB9CF7|nr:ABC transporter ATP-binding protein [Psychrobacillus sp. OK032]SES17640.1 ABC-2 type transport system ATP-binding protein [Psychrobacillus sp. OK032]
MIQTKDLTMQYPNGFTAVNHLNLQVNKGDIYGFLGPNGAGKTTTIRMLDGLLKPTAGEVVIQGKSVIRNEREIRKMIGVLPESHGYYNWMTGAEYLLFFAQLYGVSKNKQKERVEEVLQQVGMTSKANIPIGQYSRGMRQRIGIAKTIIHEPVLIFLDEPTLGLDPQGQRDIQMILHDLNKKHGVTIFITSHLLKEISEICNRVAIVKEGNLIEEDYLESLLNKYGSLKVDTTEPITLEEVFFYLTDQEDKEMNL